MNVKQVIVIRRDLKMRRGKEVAQGSHASMMFLSLMVQQRLLDGERTRLSPAQQAWITGRFTKVCVQVPDEAALLAVAEEARKAGLECHVVTDAGLTEFGGVPTNTCLAIGPDEADKIDMVTGKLSLY
jgi:PTH2 family peptidyl-tRNA hydrolase